MTTLFDLVEELVAIPSESRHEQAITDHVEALLAGRPWLALTRVGNNLVARTDLGRPRRLLLAGHTDTVPASPGQAVRREGDVLWGLGACDMKGGVAVLVELARTVSEPAHDVTYVFYECEEIEASANGLGRLAAEAPDLLAADAAVLAEPTGARVEAGCQGTMRVAVTLGGVRAHSARPWTGRNAIHRLGPLLRRLEGYEGRRPVLDGCQYRESLQAVRVAGGVAGNVVPDRAVLTLNHRFAPDRTPAEAEAHVREVVGECDGFDVLDVAPGARPGLDHPLLARLVAGTGSAPAAKLGWTDVSRFAARGLPALNFGPGDPLLAHAADERVERAQVEEVHAALRDLLAGTD